MKARYSKIKYQLSNNMKILFVGTNPHPGSYRRMVPFSNNKMFWYLLSESGLLPFSRAYLQDDANLKKIYTDEFIDVYHLGLINLIYRPTKTVAVLKQSEAGAGSKRVLSAILRYQPPVVCFISKKSYQLFTGSPHCIYGWHPDIGKSKVFVMHSPIHGFASIRIKELKEVGIMAGLLKN